MGSSEQQHDEHQWSERRQVLRKLKTATVLCSFFLVAEVAGGLLSGSLAVLSDAAHLFADLASFAVAIAASHLAGLPSTTKHTYGLKRTESLAALFSASSLAFICVGLAGGALKRLLWPPETPIDGGIMTAIAGIGVIVNVALAVVLGEDHVHLPGGSSCDHGGHDHSHSHEHGKDCHGDGHHDEEDHDAHGHHSHDDHSCDSHSHDDHSHDDHSHEHTHEHSPKKDHEDEAKNESSPLLVPHGNHDHAKCEDSHHEHDKEHSREEHQRNINLQAAYLHVMGDLAQSLAVFLGGLVIWFKPEWHAIDPILTLVFSGLVLWSVNGVLKSSLSVLLEETPAGIDWQEVYDTISAVPGVENVHDLHIWCISHGQTAISVHCTSPDDQAIETINEALRRYGIMHTTIQVNRGKHCGTCPAENRNASNKSICDQIVQ